MAGPRSATWLRTVAALALAAVLAGCGDPPDDDGGDATNTGGGTHVPGPDPDPVPAADCEESSTPVAPAPTEYGVSFTLTTDPTRTSMLLTNTGQMTLIVVPDAHTGLIQAPSSANPDDPASQAALYAVASSGAIAATPGYPFGVTPDQVYVVPPGWSVCGLTSDLDYPANLRYLRDKASSGSYFVTKYLADALVARITPASLKRSQTLELCARGVLDLLRRQPDLSHVDLYVAVIATGTACRSSYTALLGQDEVAARQVESKALTWLKRTPSLVKNTKFFLALLRG